MKFSHRGTAHTFFVATLTITFGFLIVLAGHAAPIPSNHLQVHMNSFVLDGAYTVVAGQPTGEGSLKNGNVGEYPEGACLPVSVSVTNNWNDQETGDATVTVEYDYYHDGLGIIGFNPMITTLSDPVGDADNLNDFTFETGSFNDVTSFLTESEISVDAIITGPFAGDGGTDPVGPTDTVQHYIIDLIGIPKHDTATVLFCAQLDQDASEYGGGASMSIRSGTGGKENVAVMARQLLILPSLTISKVVSGGTSLPSDWSFTVSPAINGQSIFTIPSGNSEVVIDNVSPDGTYTITENAGPEDYTLTSIAGTNCTADSGAASAALAAENPAVNASCEFTNTYNPPPPPFVATTGTVLVVKNVVNDDVGTSLASDFTLNATGTTPSLTSFPGDASGTLVTFDEGAFAITEDAVDGYGASFSADCVGTMIAGEALTCTVTNDDDAVIVDPPPFVATTGTVLVVKNVVNDDVGTSLASDFTLNATGTTPSLTSFPGDASGTLVTFDEGAFAITEDAVDGYTASLSDDCTGTIVAGEALTCTVTNDDDAVIVDPPDGGDPTSFTATTGTLLVIKSVVNDNVGTSLASDFTLNATGTTPSLTSFPGDASGTLVILDAGPYEITEDTAEGYGASFSADCVGTMIAGEALTCTVTNDDDGDKGNGDTGGTGDTGGSNNDGGGSGPGASTNPGSSGISASGFASPAGGSVLGIQTPAVLGISTTADADPADPSDPGDTAPEPQVLGISIESLPVTGFPVEMMLVFSAPALWLLRRKN
jgi:hypothetical protein